MYADNYTTNISSLTEFEDVRSLVATMLSLAAQGIAHHHGVQQLT